MIVKAPDIAGAFLKITDILVLLLKNQLLSMNHDAAAGNHLIVIEGA